MRVRFVGVSVRRRWLVGTIWLKRRVSHPLIGKVDFLGRQDYVHRFKLTHAGEIDAAFQRLLREAYAVGRGDSHVFPDSEKR